MYKDAIDTAGQSKDGEISEELLRFFVSVQDRYRHNRHFLYHYCCHKEAYF
jgi:hypothetical protein